MVGATSRSGASRIFRVSLISFISSPVYPLSPKRSMAGIRLNAIWCAKWRGVIASPRAQASVSSRSASMPCTPAPDTAWYDVATTRRSRPASCSGLSGITVTMVVQFGLARMPSWRRAPS